MTNFFTAIGLGLGAGINAYATLLVFGLLARWKTGMFPSELATFFSSTPVLIVVGVLYVIEFLADKVPVIDHAWDVIHTFIRVPAGAIVAYAATSVKMSCTRRRLSYCGNEKSSSPSSGCFRSLVDIVIKRSGSTTPPGER